jgi:transposase
MKNSSTLAIEGIEIFKANQLTIGLDLGDRTSRYCVLNEAGEIILEQELATTPKGFEQCSARFRGAGSRWKPERIRPGSAGS